MSPHADSILSPMVRRRILQQGYFMLPITHDDAMTAGLPLSSQYHGRANNTNDEKTYTVRSSQPDRTTQFGGRETGRSRPRRS